MTILGTSLLNETDKLSGSWGLLIIRNSEQENSSDTDRWNLLKVLFDLTLLGVLGDAVDEQSAFHLQDTKLGLPHGSAHKCHVLRVHGLPTRSSSL